MITIRAFLGKAKGMHKYFCIGHKYKTNNEQFWGHFFFSYFIKKFMIWILKLIIFHLSRKWKSWIIKSCLVISLKKSSKVMLRRKFSLGKEKVRYIQKLCKVFTAFWYWAENFSRIPILVLKKSRFYDLVQMETWLTIKRDSLTSFVLFGHLL